MSFQNKTYDSHTNMTQITMSPTEENGPQAQTQIKYECGLCDSTFSSSDLRCKHAKETHHSIQNPSCKLCGHAFTNQARLHSHFAIHSYWKEKPYKCLNCPSGFNAKCQLVNHNRVTHRETGREEVARDSDLVLENRLTRLSRRTNKTQILKSQTENTVEDKQGEYYKCNNCRSKFRYRTNLDAHIRKVHPAEHYNIWDEAHTYENSDSDHIGGNDRSPYNLTGEDPENLMDEILNTSGKSMENDTSHVVATMYKSDQALSPSAEQNIDMDTDAFLGNMIIVKSQNTCNGILVFESEVTIPAPAHVPVRNNPSNRRCGNGLNPVPVVSEDTQALYFRHSHLIETPCPIPGINSEVGDMEINGLDQHLIEYRVGPEVVPRHIERCNDKGQTEIQCHFQRCGGFNQRDKLTVDETNHTEENNLMDICSEPENEVDCIEPVQNGVHDTYVCGESYNEKDNLIVHERTHTEENNTMDEYEDKDSLLLVHNEQTTTQYACEICEVYFVEQFKLNKHEKSHREEMPSTEEKADGNFEVSNEENSTKKTQYPCEICGEIFSETDKLIAHDKTHSQENNLMETCIQPENSHDNIDVVRNGEIQTRCPCEICVETYNEQYKLTEHEKSHTGENNSIVSEVCGILKVSDEVSMNQTHYPCVLFSESFTEKYKLTEHEKIHKEENNSIVPERVCGILGVSDEESQIQAQFLCETCGNSCNELCKLTEHEVNHMGDTESIVDCLDQEDVTENAETENETQTYREGCSALSVDDLNHTEENNFKEKYPQPICYEIEKEELEVLSTPPAHTRENSPKLYKIHKPQPSMINFSTTTGQKTYKCDICKLKFRQKEYLRRHILNHKGDRLTHPEVSLTRDIRTQANTYKCVECEDSFTRVDNLIAHKKARHTRESTSTSTVPVLNTLKDLSRTRPSTTEMNPTRTTNLR